MAWQIIEIAVRKASLFIRASSLFLRPSSFRASACWRAPSLTAPAKYVAHSRAPPFNAFVACSTAACNKGGSSAAIAQEHYLTFFILSLGTLPSSTYTGFTGSLPWIDWGAPASSAASGSTHAATRENARASGALAVGRALVYSTVRLAAAAVQTTDRQASNAAATTFVGATRPKTPRPVAVGG